MEEDLKTFAEAEVLCYVATRDAELQPEGSFGWGPRFVGDNQIEIFLDRVSADKQVQNLRSNRQVAITISSPLNYRTVQVKGWCSDIDEPSAEDNAWIERHRGLITSVMRARGVPAHLTRAWWSRDVIKLRCVIEARFDQTPGPGAGAAL